MPPAKRDLRHFSDRPRRRRGIHMPRDILALQPCSLFTEKGSLLHHPIHIPGLMVWHCKRFELVTHVNIISPTMHGFQRHRVHISLDTRPTLFLPGQWCQESSQNVSSLALELERLVGVLACVRVPFVGFVPPTLRFVVGWLYAPGRSSSSSPFRVFHIWRPHERGNREGVKRFCKRRRDGTSKKWRNVCGRHP